MTKTVSVGFASHLARNLTKLATCMRVVRTDGVILTATSLDVGLTFDVGSGDEVYEPFGFNITDVRGTSETEVSTLDATGILDSETITEDDLRAGRWDGAAYEIFRVVWSDLTLGREIMSTGVLGECSVELLTFKTELLGLMQKVQSSIVEITTAACRAIFGDSRCQVDLDALAVTGTIEAMDAGYYEFTDSSRSEDAGYFVGGVITILTSTDDLLNGMSFEILTHGTGGEFKLQIAFPYDATGATYSMTPGCDKTLRTCIDVFDNILNRRAEDWVQGIDKLVSVGRHN